MQQSCADFGVWHVVDMLNYFLQSASFTAGTLPEGYNNDVCIRVGYRP